MRINYVFVGLWIGFFWSFFYAPCNVLYECKGSGVKVPNSFVRALVTLYT